MGAYQLSGRSAELLHRRFRSYMLRQGFPCACYVDSSQLSYSSELAFLRSCCSARRCRRSQVFTGIPVTVEWYRRSLRGIEHQFIFVRVVSRGVSEATKSPELALSRSREELLPGANLIYYTTKRRELKLFSKEL